jgi:hypothetical protein
MTRLYCILARAADTGVIFRRGPSKLVRLISWDLQTHTFQPGQWFKGRIYERKSDLSPNGTKLLYVAAKPRGKIQNWIAISSPPFLTAHVLWSRMGTYGEVSLFKTDSMLALSTYNGASSLEPAHGFAVPRQLRVKPKPWPGYFHRLADHDRLVRDGWAVRAGDPVYNSKSASQGHPVVYRRPVPGGTRSTCLEMSATSETNITYAVRDDLGSFVALVADWADVRGEDVLYAHGGRLFRIRVAKRGKQIECGQPIELDDFSDMKFEPIEAPAWATKW